MNYFFDHLACLWYFQAKEFITLSEGDKAEVTLSPNKNIFERIADAIASLWS